MPKDTPSTQVFADYEVITPTNKLRKAISTVPLAPGEDPIARAEKALEDLSKDFGSWMDEECTRLDKARGAVKRQGFTKATKDGLFHAAHDIKGEAATFGFPAIAAAADSLCRLIEHSPDVTKIPMTIIDQHVDSVRAIYREYERSDAIELAAVLTGRLREVTDEFLIHENRNRPDVLELLKSPSIAPGQEPA